ncbi:MAG: rRNA maturation RNase YbeY [Deltaproteobacteria bacterium]|nr:rRNA maturation RNase YbeY [Deltaproteobacteria bacterium]
MPIAVTHQPSRLSNRTRREWLRRKAEKVLRKLQLQRSDLSITICDDEYITRLNTLWRNIGTTTDVLSFPASDPSEVRNPDVSGEIPPPLGDIVINLQWLERENSGDIQYSLARLFVHGIAHLLGYDHDSEENALMMKTKELELMSIVNPEFCGILDGEKYLVT